jgi:starvation-inducible DNA-binding protein
MLLSNESGQLERAIIMGAIAMRKLNIGLTEEQRAGVCELLNKDLADANLLLIKTKKYHWDVTGPEFRSLHQIWEEQYEILNQTIDSTAERVRALGNYPLGTLKALYVMARSKSKQKVCQRRTKWSQTW